MTTETDTAAEAAQTREDKFFGVTTSIDDMAPQPVEKEAEPEIVVENAEDAPVEKAATPQKPALKKEAGASDDDVEEYSKKVQKRIKTLTWEAREAERQRDTAAAERDETTRIAKQLYGQNQQQDCEARKST